VAHAIDYTMQHPAVLTRPFALRQKGLANKLPAALALGSQAAALYLTSSYGADLTGRLARWRWIKGETEEMPLLSRRRQPLPAPSFAIRTPWDTKSFYIKLLPVIGAGACLRVCCVAALISYCCPSRRAAPPALAAPLQGLPTCLLTTR
jgi:hypothetical protein